MRTERFIIQVPVIICEAPDCDVQFPLDKAYGIKQLIACVPQRINPIECDGEMHYGCTLEHAKAAADQCYIEHLLPSYKAEVEKAFIEGRG